MKYWSGEKSRYSSYVRTIADSDKKALRENFLELLATTTSISIRVNLSWTLNRMISNDFPNEWPGLLEKVRNFLLSGDMGRMMSGAAALLEIVKSFRYRQANAPLMAEVIEATFPTIVNLGQKLLDVAQNSPPPPKDHNADNIPYLLHIFLKTYKSTLVLNLSKHQMGSESIVPWGSLLFAVIRYQVPKELLERETSEEARERMEWWKAKKWAYGTLDRLFHRYVSLIYPSS